MIIVCFALIIVFIVLAIFIYMYLDECMKVRKRLHKLGVNEVEGITRKLSLGYLRELLYEKETELAEECFLTVEKDI